jgi:hypothetical protein
MKIVDGRDEMHKRGWTWFRISGDVGGRQIHGKGRIPFGYEAYKTHAPWLQLTSEDGIELVDTKDSARLIDRRGGRNHQETLPSGSFFCGLLRPWVGFHTVDMIRRDAAARRIPFETQSIDDEMTVVRLMDRDRQPPGAISYRIDMDHDLLEQMVFVCERENATSGVMKFEYLQQVSGQDAEFAPPALSAAAFGQPAAPAPGPMWPILLLNASN